MALVAFVVHPDRPDAEKAAEGARTWLEAKGHRFRRITDATGPALGPDVDVAVSLGGDGTMLRTVVMAAGAGVPVLGVNLGRLGYLTEIEPGALEPALAKVLDGDFEVERRMLLDVGLEPAAGPPAQFPALNEAVLEKTVPGHTVRMALHIAGRPFVTYAADGILVATPTGSTAYNLSVRGPIVSPCLQALVVTPISPHMLFDRPLVLDPAEWVSIEMLDPRPAVLVVDGQQVGELEPGDKVTCRPWPHPALLVTFGQRDFHAILRSRFGLADR